MKALLSRHKKRRTGKRPARRRVDLVDSVFLDFDMENWDEEDFDTDESDDYDDFDEVCDDYEDDYEDEYDESDEISDDYEDDYYDDYDEAYEVCDEPEDDCDEADYEEDDYDGYEEDYEEDYDDYEDYGEYDDCEEEEYKTGKVKRRRRKRKASAHHMTFSDSVLVLTTLLVFVMAFTAGSFYLRAKAEEEQIAAFAQIGEEAGEIEVIGESGLLAIADAQAAKLIAAQLEREEEERIAMEEQKKAAVKTEVVMNLTSIQKDLKIKFINKKSERLIANVAFEVKLTGSSGQTLTLVDEDRDGIIYEKEIAPGKYQAVIAGPAELEEYSFSEDPVTITVKDTIEYKKVDVADEVKTEAQVNVKAEDTKVNETVVESANTDTVEWVESTKTLIEGTDEQTEEYQAVDRSRIADPALKAALGFRLLTADLPSENPGDPVADPTVEPVPEPTVEVTAEPTPEATVEPTAEPTAEITPEPVPEPTAEVTLEPTVEPTAIPEPSAAQVPSASPLAEASPTQTPSEVPSASPSETPMASPSATPSVSPTATPDATPTADPAADAKNDTVTSLLTTEGDKLYVKDGDGNFREAKYADFYNEEIKEFFIKSTKTTGQYRYTGWQTIDGATYYYDKNGNPVTGEQVIQGAKYTFNENGVLNTGSGQMGIDVSKWNGSIDWNAVKNSGVSYVIIRCGYRGSSTGALIEDPMFRTNIKGAQSAGLKVGVYFFTQAVNEVEAVEEASMVLGLIRGYNISYPVFLDVEPSNGRGDAISTEARTAVCRAFCQTIQNSGYKAGIYANKNWLTEKINAGSLTSYKIWLAQYAAAPTYSATKYDLWQYSSKGSVAGIKGSVDMNISYLGY